MHVWKYVYEPTWVVPRSMEFMREKEEKKKLEQRIAMLMGQMIRGDGSGGNGPSATNSTGAVLPSNG